MALAGKYAAKVLHGFGTGILKSDVPGDSCRNGQSRIDEHIIRQVACLISYSP